MGDIKFSCSKCGHHIVIDAKAVGASVKCPECGVGLTVPAAQQINQEEDLIPTCCPKCRSEDFKRVPLAWELDSGVTFRGGTGPQKTETTQSFLARKLEPPEPPAGPGFTDGVGFLLLLAGGVMFFFHWRIGLALTLCSVPFIAISVRKQGPLEKEAARYKEAMTAWDRSWFCFRCGHVWEMARKTEGAQ